MYEYINVCMYVCNPCAIVFYSFAKNKEWFSDRIVGISCLLLMYVYESMYRVNILLCIYVCMYGYMYE